MNHELTARARDITIGFCTTCTNRLWQLEQTLARNLRALEGTDSFVALVNFNSTDGLDDWVNANFSAAIESGALLYLWTKEPPRFHASVAKNLAHRLALLRRPDVLFNLDADNFLAKKTVRIVQDVFSRFADPCLHNWTGKFKEGSFGRIALRTETWKRIGGYHEKHYPTHGQDDDIIRRSVLNGAQYLRVSAGVPLPIPNTAEQKIENLALGPDLLGARADDVLAAMNLENKALLDRTLHDRLSVEEQKRFLGFLNSKSDLVI